MTIITNYIEIDGKLYEKRLRRLTPRECLRLMGFDDEFKIVVSDTQMYKQAGNSIVVNVLESIFSQIDWEKVLDDELYKEFSSGDSE